MKRFVCFCIFFLALGALFAKDDRVEWEIVEDTYSIEMEHYKSIFFRKGETVYSSSDAFFTSAGYIVPVFAKDDIYCLNIDTIIPKNTVDIFDKKILSKTGSDRMYWLRDYFVDILKSGNRDTALQFEKKSLTEWEKNYNEFDGHWYQHPNNPVHNCVDLSNVVIRISGISGQLSSYFIKNIKRIPGGYNVYARCYLWRVDDTFIDENQFPQKDSDVLLLLRIDGDYLDIFLNNEGNRIGSFVLVDTAFYKQCENQIFKNTSDLSKITWPRRDYDSALIGSTGKTTDNLRLRSMQERKSHAITTLVKDTSVDLIDIGRRETIDGINSRWVQVKTETGETGWCFGGYLDPRP
ncbi:MAG: SH3 domain-containing protein [Erysipelotrichaceae bacterium]|nr:SH3 domain-containing protein [Erysipelotrichaceae bacterium]